MPDLPTTSVVIPTHGRRALLEDVLAPVLADPATAEVVVVVDGCDDGSIELVEELRRHDEPPRGPLGRGRGPERRPPGRRRGRERRGRRPPRRRRRRRAGLVPATRAPTRTATGSSCSATCRSAAEAAPRQLAVDLYAAWYEECVARLRGATRSRCSTASGPGTRRCGARDALRVGLARPSFTATYNADRDFGLRCARAGSDGRVRPPSARRATSIAARSSAARRGPAPGEGAGAVHHRHRDLVGPLPATRSPRASRPRAPRSSRARPPAASCAAAPGRRRPPVAAAPRAAPGRARRAAALVDLRVGQQAAATAARPPPAGDRAAAGQRRHPCLRARRR